jgi:acyl transferase domain-containing protein
MQLNVKLVSQRQTTKCFLTFFGLPFNDIVATAANMLVENSPQAIANIINKLNNKEMDWDASNQHTGYYINNILRDLHAIVSAAVLDHVTYQQAQKNAKVIEAKTLAYVNKVRVKNTTALTQTTLDRVDTEVKKATVNEKDLLRRQKELETTIAKQQEEFNAHVKSQQKNSQGSSSAQWPQHKQIQWIPPQKTTTVPTIPASPPPTTTTTIPNKTKEIVTNSTNEHAKSTKQKRTKKRKISQKK